MEVLERGAIEAKVWSLQEEKNRKKEKVNKDDGIENGRSSANYVF